MLNWNERRKLNEKLNSAGALEPACPDGHTVLLARSDSPTVFFIDEEGNVTEVKNEAAKEHSGELTQEN